MSTIKIYVATNQFFELGPIGKKILRTGISNS